MIFPLHLIFLQLSFAPFNPFHSFLSFVSRFLLSSLFSFQTQALVHDVIQAANQFARQGERRAVPENLCW